MTGLDVTQVRWPDEATGPRRIDLTWADINGRVECIGVALWPGDAPSPVLASEVRTIPLAGVIQKAREQQREHLADAAGRNTRYEQLLAEAVRSLGDPRPGPGRPRELGPEVLAKSADVYLSAWQRGEPPTMAVAEHFRLSASAAAKRVSLCRKAGLLAETTTGRPSGRPPIGDDGPPDHAPVARA